jgi:diacylglycerol kinase family enzyme
VDAVSVMVANVGELFARWLPLRLPLAERPVGAWSDGLLEVVIIAPRNPQDIARCSGRPPTAACTAATAWSTFQAERITIDADPPIAVQIDGDPAGETPISMAVMKDALRVIVPTPRTL